MHLDKTHVIPVGKQDNQKDIICPDLGIEWASSFNILGFKIDNKLKALDKNYTNVFNKIKGIIKKWTPNKLSLRGRLTLAKTMLVSQLTFIRICRTGFAR